MAGNELENLFSDTSSAKQNLKEASSKAQEAIRRRKEIQARMESLRRSIQSAAEESEEAKEEYERLAAELASLPEDDNEDDGNGYGGNSAMRQAVLSQMLAAQQRYQAAQKRKQAYVQELQRKKKEFQQLQNELNMLRVRLQNLREMFESLKQRYSREKEKNSQVASRFGSIQGSRFGQSAGAGQSLAVSKQNICERGVQFCENQKQIAEGWSRTIEQAQGPGQHEERGDGGRDYE